MPIKNDSKSPVKYIIEITFGLDIQEGGSSALSIWLQGLFFMQFISQEKSGWLRNALRLPLDLRYAKNILNLFCFHFYFFFLVVRNLPFF